MPNKVVNSAPSPTLLQRMGLQDTPDPEFDKRMGLAQSKMRQEMPNEMANANIQPTGLFTGLTNRLKGQSAGGNVVATTGPFGGISYSKDLLSKMSQNELEDTLAHELTHVGQYSAPGVNGGPPTLSLSHGLMNFAKALLPGGTATSEGLPKETMSNYSQHGWNPDYRGSSAEMEAYGKEDARRNARGDILRPGDDIQLFSPRKSGINTGPSKGGK